MDVDVIRKTNKIRKKVFDNRGNVYKKRERKKLDLDIVGETEKNGKYKKFENQKI